MAGVEARRRHRPITMFCKASTYSMGVASTAMKGSWLMISISGVGVLASPAREV